MPSVAPDAASSQSQRAAALVALGPNSRRAESRAAPSPARKLGACAAQRVKYESKNGAPAA